MPNKNGSAGDGYRYGFNGMEEDSEIKGNKNSYDFGARMYDPRVGRWLSIDPLAAEYPSLSPYNFVANSPLVFVDSDGRDIKLYDEKGTHVATYSDGKAQYFNGGADSEIVKSYEKVKEYVGGHSAVFDDLENDNGILEIYIQTDPIGGGNFTPDWNSAEARTNDSNGDGVIQDDEVIVDGKSDVVNGKINWDPSLAMVDTKGNTHSPALILTHEAYHAANFMTRMDRFIDNFNVGKGSGQIGFGAYDNREEYDAITQTNEVSKSLYNASLSEEVVNLDGGNGNRNDHDSEYMKNVSCVVCLSSPEESWTNEQEQILNSPAYQAQPAESTQPKGYVSPPQ